MKTICVILAGGQSSRMGRDKATLPLDGGTFLSRLTAEYAPGFPVYVSVAAPGRFPHMAELPDLHPGMGPLAGLEAALVRTDADAVFLTATDLPFGTLALARRLLQELGEADACVIERTDGRVEPTFGVYRRSCLPALERCLAEGRRAMRSLLEQVTVQRVLEKTLEFPVAQLLQNVNTPQEYERAKARLSGGNCCGVTTPEL